MSFTFYFCNMGRKINWDVLGISASVACAIHCAVLPLVLTSLPVFGINILDHAGFELLMILLAAAVGAFSLYHGYKKHHHRVLPVFIFLLGMLFLFAKQVWHDQQLWLLLPAVMLIVTAHFSNYLFCKKAAHCHADDCAH